MKWTVEKIPVGKDQCEECIFYDEFDECSIDINDNPFGFCWDGEVGNITQDYIFKIVEVAEGTAT